MKNFLNDAVIVLMLLAVVGYLTLHDNKHNFKQLDDCKLMTFVERINGHDKIGLCDSGHIVLREAVYSSVDSQGGFVVAYGYDTPKIDIFLANGDSVLTEVEKDFVIFNPMPVAHLEVYSGPSEYIILSDGQVVGPAQSMTICQRQQVIILTGGDEIGIKSFDNTEILPQRFDKIIFVNQKNDDGQEKLDYIAALNACGNWIKFSPQGTPCGEIDRQTVVEMLQNPSCEMQTGNVVFSVTEC